MASRIPVEPCVSFTRRDRPTLTNGPWLARMMAQTPLSWILSDLSGLRTELRYIVTTFHVIFMIQVCNTLRKSVNVHLDHDPG